VPEPHRAHATNPADDCHAEPATQPIEPRIVEPRGRLLARQREQQAERYYEQQQQVLHHVGGKQIAVGQHAHRRHEGRYEQSQPGNKRREAKKASTAHHNQVRAEDRRGN